MKQSILFGPGDRPYPVLVDGACFGPFDPPSPLRFGPPEGGGYPENSSLFGPGEGNGRNFILGKPDDWGKVLH